MSLKGGTAEVVVFLLCHRAKVQADKRGVEVRRHTGAVSYTWKVNGQPSERQLCLSCVFLVGTQLFGSHKLGPTCGKYA